MAQRTHQRRVRRRLRRTPAVLLCLLAAPLTHGATAVSVDVRGVDDALRDNVLAYLSFERYKKGAADLTPDTVERLHNRVEREVDAALKPFGYYEPQVQSAVTRQDNGEWHVVIDIVPGPPVIVEHMEVRVEGPGETDPLFRRILRRLPLRTGDVLNHKAYEDIKSDLQRTAATYGYLDAKLIENDDAGRSAESSRRHRARARHRHPLPLRQDHHQPGRHQGQPRAALPALPRGGVLRPHAGAAHPVRPR